MIVRLINGELLVTFKYHGASIAQFG